MARRSLPPQVRARGVKAVLGPTNTGKTHLAIERMLGHDSGMIGLPLRLLAREVYNRVVEKAGPHNVALITGEEKIKPDRPRYWISTVEAMPRDLDLAFVAVDEIQLASDLDRGHVFTDRLLNQRGREETLLIGSATMRPLIEALIPGVHVVTRPRLSMLSFAGEKKVSRLPRRSAIVAFSAEEVYGIAELIRRQSGGAAVVLGALSPRTRNAQVELYQNGDVDYLIATDAIGMGLNLDVDHVAFASDKKFDGFQFRKLNNSELAQIAGRAGRYMRDGTFGTSGRCPPSMRKPSRRWKTIPSTRCGSCNGAIRTSISPHSPACAIRSGYNRGSMGSCGRPRARTSRSSKFWRGKMTFRPSPVRNMRWSGSGRSARCRIIGRFPRKLMRILSASSIVS